MEASCSQPASLLISDYVHDPCSSSECWVCGAICYGQHFGIFSCRACAAFFRRSVAKSKKYKCRQKTKCPIHKDSRNMCRACRLEKCFRLGMKSTNIQLYRDAIGTTVRERLPSVALLAAVKDQYPLLSRLMAGYEEYHQRQRTLYAVMYPEHMFCEEVQFKRVSFLEFRNFCRACLPLQLKVLERYYPMFEALPNKEKALILDQTTDHVNILDQGYQSAQFFPDPDDTKVFLHYGQYIDDEKKFFFCQYDKDPAESDRLLRPIASRVAPFVRKSKRLRLTKFEVTALIGIVTYREIVAMLPHRNMEPIQLQLMQDLAEYCDEAYADQASSRVGVLLCLLRDVEFIQQAVLENIVANGLQNSHCKRATDKLVDLADH